MLTAIPPIGQITENDHGAVVTHLTRLAQEASFARAEWEQIVDDNLKLYTYGTLDPGGDNLIVNEIQNAIVAATDIQTKEPPDVQLDPVETGEPGQVYWAGPSLIGLRLGLPPQMADEWIGEDGQPHTALPLDELSGDAVQQAVAAGMIKPQWVVNCDDKLVADTYQSVFDVYWMRSSTDRFLRSNLLTTNVQGWTFALVEFDDDEQRFLLRMLSIRQVHIDPTVEDIQDAAYVGVDQVIDADQAKALYPHLEAVIDKHAVIGEPMRPDGLRFGQAYDRDFQRPMIVLRTFWLRNQSMALTPDEALTAGHVEMQMVPAPAAPPGSTLPGLIGATDGSQAAPPPAGQDAAGATGQGDNPSPDNGLQSGDNSAQQPQGQSSAQQMKLILAGAGIEVTPDHPAWPTKRTLRQITTIASTVVDDRACEHWDIPLLHNVNLPLPGRPWGLGEPFRLKSLQEARSRMLDAITQHCEFYRAPIVGMSQSMWEKLPDEYKDGFVRPGMTLVIPDEQWNLSAGKIMSIVDPPQTPPALVDMQAILKTEMTDQSGHSEVLQGRADSQMSGKAIGLLQTSATSMIGFKSSRTGDVVQRLGKLMLHCLTTRVSLDQVQRIVSKYPPHVLASIYQRAQSIEWDVKVTISSGSGALIAQKKQEAIQQFQIGAITLETLHDALGIDHQQETQRARTALAAMPQPAQPAGQPQQSKSQGPPNA